LAALFVLVAACAGEAPPPAAPPPAAETATAVATAAPAPPPAAETATAVAAPAPPPPAETAKPAEAAPAAAKTTSGEAVFYDPNGRGSCALAFARTDAVLSAPPGVYQKLEGCGACLEITGSTGTAVVEVVDLCPSCPDNNLVISKGAFEKIAGKASGRAQVSWKQVPCAVQGPLSFRFKETSSQYWTAIQIRNHRLPIKGVAFKKGADWVPMDRSNDNYFAAAKGVGTGPVTLRITAGDGQQIEETIKTWKDGQTYPGAAQFK
jgi:expansin (peptidoglycan-binding protein)